MNKSIGFLILNLLAFSQGCGPATQAYDEQDIAPPTPAGCSFVSMTNGAKVVANGNLYIYSCASRPQQNVLLYLNKYGMMERICDDSTTHLCP